MTSAAEKTAIKSEQENKEMRDKNLIVFGVTESNTKEETVHKIQDLLKKCHLSTNIEQHYVHRLGRVDSKKANNQNGAKPRPIKICTNSNETKWDILKRINDLKEQGIFAKPDLTKKEQEADFRLRQELKQKREDNPSHTFKIQKSKVVQINKPPANNQ